MKKVKGEVWFYIIVTSFIIMAFLFTIYILDIRKIYEKNIEKLYDIVMDSKKENIKEIVDMIIENIQDDESKVVSYAEDLIEKLNDEIDKLPTYEEKLKLIKDIEILNEAYLYLKIEVIIWDNDSKEIIYHTNNGLIEFKNENELMLYTENYRTFIKKYIEQYKKTIIIGIRNSDIDRLVKITTENKVRKIALSDEGYVWINEIINYDGGDGYARRLVHPNLIETEGMLLSTNIKDKVGNLPYLEELEKIKENGEAYLEYYFKKKTSDEMALKVSYVKLYEPYNWVIGTGVYLDDLEKYVKENNEDFRMGTQKQIKLTIITSILLFIITGITGLILFNYYELNNLLLGIQKEALRKQHYEIMESKYDKSNEIIHDIKNHLLYISSLAYEDRNHKIIDYIKSINEDINQVGYIIVTGNKILDIIVNEKIESIKSSNIKFNHSVENIKLDFMDKKDLVTVVGNLIDNAIEGCRHSKEKTINFEMYLFNDFIVIKVINNCEMKPKVRRSILQTNKLQRDYHGYGMKNIRRSLEKYEGDLIWEYDEENKEFKVVIMMPKKD